MHEAQQYHVDRLDFDQRKAYVQRVDVDYFTDAIRYTQVKPLEVDSRSGVAGPALLRPRRRAGAIAGGRIFKKIKFFTLENVGSGKLELPENEMHTTAYWITLSRTLLASLPFDRTDRQDGMFGLLYALESIASLLLMCDRRDLGTAIGEGGEDAGGQDHTADRGHAAPGSGRESVRTAAVPLRRLPRRHRLRNRCTARTTAVRAPGPSRRASEKMKAVHVGPADDLGLRGFEDGLALLVPAPGDAPHRRQAVPNTGARPATPRTLRTSRLGPIPTPPRAISAEKRSRQAARTSSSAVGYDHPCTCRVTPAAPGVLDTPAMAEEAADSQPSSSWIRKRPGWPAAPARMPSW